MPDIVRDNKAQHRFEMSLGDDTAVAYYSLTPGVITFTHTEVPSALRGQGIASRLMHGVLQTARAEGLKKRVALDVELGLYDDEQVGAKD